MARLFLAVWLAAFAVQTSDILMVVAPDTCTEDVQGSAADPCPDGCPRCFCCARVPAFIPFALAIDLPEPATLAVQLPPLDPSTTASPRGVLHVPKSSLI